MTILQFSCINTLSRFPTLSGVVTVQIDSPYEMHVTHLHSGATVLGFKSQDGPANVYKWRLCDKIFES